MSHPPAATGRSPGTAGAAVVSAPRRGERRNHQHSTGTIVRATTREASRATVAVTAKGRNSSPARPPTKAMGRNTATETRVEAVIAVATSRVPSRIAVRRSAPRPRCRRMFSTTTIASSTTRPIEIVSAPSVSVLRE